MRRRRPALIPSAPRHGVWSAKRGEASMAKGRRDINALTDDELRDYIHALDVLRQRSAQNPDDETGYVFQAALHNDMFVGPCEHGSDLFFPWHRAHLHYFEQLLQATDPPRTANVTIPYWDWLHPEVNGRFPKAFANPGLFKPGRNVNPTPGLLGEKLPDDTLEIVTEETDWNDFGGFPEDDPTGNFGDLEIGPHNYMHGLFISGLMGDPSRPARVSREAEAQGAGFSEYYGAWIRVRVHRTAGGGIRHHSSVADGSQTTTSRAAARTYRRGRTSQPAAASAPLRRQSAVGVAEYI